MLWLTRQSLKRPPITIMLAVVMIIVGIVSSRSLKQELFPDISFPVISVSTLYPGASSETMDQEVTVPIEKAIESMSGVQAVQSTSLESFAITVVSFDVDIDIKEARQEVQERVNALSLPSGAQQPTFGTLSFTALPVVIASVSGEDLSEVQGIVESDVIPEISALPGVSSVTLTGGQEDKLIVTLDPEKMAETNVSQCQVISFLQANNLTFPVGTISDEALAFPVRVTNSYTSTEALGQVVVGIRGVDLSSFGGGMGGGMGGDLPCIATPAPQPTPTPAPTAEPTAVTTATAPLGADLVPPAFQDQGITTPEQITPDVIAQIPPQGLSVIELPLALALPEESQAALAAALPAPEVPAEFQAQGITALEQLTPDVVALIPAPALAQLPVELVLALPEPSQAAIAATLAQAAPSTPSTPAPSTPGVQLPPEFAAFGITSPEQITPDVIAQTPAAFLSSFTPELIAALPEESQAALAARLENPEDAAAFPEESLIRLEDIGTVLVGSTGGTTISRTNGEPGVGIEVAKDTTGNTVEIVDAVEAAFARLEGETGLEFKIVREQRTPVIDSISAVTTEGIIGAIVAIVVIFLFLRSFRATMVTAVSIPLSVVVALILIRVQNFSLNVMTLGGLTVAVGRVVDDSIVVLENIYRHLRRGEDKTSAVINGTREVAGAITSSTLTTVCVFLPLGVVGGIVSKFFLPFALTVTYALLASLVVSLTIVPLLARLFIRAEQTEEEETWLQKLYTPSLVWALRSPLTKATVLVGALVLLLGSIWLAGQLKLTFLPDNSDKNIAISLQMPAGTALDVTDQATAQVEDLVTEYQASGQVREIQTIIGRSGSGQNSEFGGGASVSNQARITLTIDNEQVTDPTAFASELEQRIDGLGVFEVATVQAVASDGGGPAGSGLDLVLVGADVEKLREANEIILAEFGGNKASDRFPVANITSDLSEVKPELEIDIDPDKALASGTATALVAFQIRSLLNGTRAGDVYLADSESPLEIFVQVDPSKLDIETLRTLPVGTINPVPLESIATIREVDGASNITRINGDRATTIRGQFTTDDTLTTQSAIEDAIRALDLPEGVEVQAGAQAQSQTDTLNDMSIALLIAVILVYVVMVITFGSLMTPFVILFTLPLAIIGAVVGLYVTGKPLGITSLIGVLMLIGIVVTNAIVLLELVEQYRERGMNAYDALVRAGRVRLRPILMTALATMVALVPLALGLKKGGFIAADLAIVVIGGLFSSTFLTLLVVPVVYSIIEGIKERLGITHTPRGGDENADSTEQALA